MSDANHELEECRQLFNEEDWNSAITCLTKAIESGLEFAEAEAYRLRGQAYIKKENLPKAISDFTKAIKLDRDKSEYLTARADAYCWGQEYKYAIEDYTKALRLDPDNAHIYADRGVAYSELNKYKEADEDFETAKALPPDDDIAYYSHAESYAKRMEYDEAIDNFTAAAARHNEETPYLALPLIERGRAYYAKGPDHFEKAHKDLSKGIRLLRAEPGNPDSPPDPDWKKYYCEAMHLDAEIYEKENRSSTAKRVLQKAREMGC